MASLLVGVLFLLGVCVFVAAFVLLLWLVRLGLSLLVGRRLVRDAGGSSVMIALAITAFFFDRAIDSAFWSVTAVAGAAYEQFAFTAAGLAEQHSATLGWAVPELREHGVPVQEASRQLFGAVSLSTLLLAVSVFVLVARGMEQSEDGRGMFDGVASRLRSLSAESKQRLAFGLILCLGAYFSLGAIVAIPWLRGLEQGTPIEREEVRSRIVAAAAPGAGFDERWSAEILDEDPLALLRARFAAEDGDAAPEADVVARAAEETDVVARAPEVEADDAAGLEAAAPPVLDRVVDRGAYDAPGTAAGMRTPVSRAIAEAQLRAAMRRVDANLDTVESLWASLLSQKKVEREALVGQAMDSYQRYERTDLSQREREMYVDDLGAWYRGRNAQAEAHLTRVRGMISIYLDQTAAWARDSLAALESGEATQATPDVWDDIGTMFAAEEGATRAPPVPRQVTDLGAFNLFAGWLVDTRSFELALICGMIGFGLFGSGVSRALVGKRMRTASVGKNALEVTVVGLSAAIIIFLASQGGMALLATGAGEVNPYIVFLACFVGASYGDRVWESARERLEQALENAERANRGGGGGGEDVEGEGGDGEGEAAGELKEGQA